MDGIFRKTRPEELFSPRNGLLVCQRLERYFDTGKFAMPGIADVQKNATMSTVKSWLNCEPRQYRVRP